MRNTNTNKWQPKHIIIALATICLTLLVYTDKISADYLFVIILLFLL